MVLTGHINVTLYLGIKLEASLTVGDVPSCIFTENMAQHHLPMEGFSDHSEGSISLLVTSYFHPSEVSSSFLVVSEVMCVTVKLHGDSNSV